MFNEIFKNFIPIRQGYSIEEIMQMDFEKLEDLKTEFIKECVKNNDQKLFLNLLENSDDREKDEFLSILLIFCDHLKWINIFNSLNKEIYIFACILSFTCGFKEFFNGKENDEQYEYHKKMAFCLLLLISNKPDFMDDFIFKIEERYDLNFNFDIDIGNFNKEDLFRLEKEEHYSSLSLLYTLNGWKDIIENFLEEVLENTQEYSDILNYIKNQSSKNLAKLKLRDF